MVHFWWIWEPTWTHFGKVWGAKMEPSWYQIAPKIDLQIDWQNHPILDPSWARFWSILIPNLAPKRGSRNKLLEVFLALETVLWRRSLQDPPKRSPRLPKKPPTPPKTLPRPPPRPPKDHQRPPQRSPQRPSPRTCKTNPRTTKTIPERPSGPPQDHDFKLDPNNAQIQHMQKYQMLQKHPQCLSAATMVGNSKVGGGGPSP